MGIFEGLFAGFLGDFFEFGVFTREFASFTREFAPFTRELIH
jgi:hypothetical protein